VLVGMPGCRNDRAEDGDIWMALELGPDTLRRFADGDELAFADVYRRYSGPMFTVAFQVLGRRELAADAVQQAFVQAWRAAATFSPDGDPAPWLFTITRRAAIDVYRKERRHALLDRVEDGPEPAEPGPSLEAAWESWQVRRALDALPPDERDVVRLTAFQGLSHTETAERLDVPVGTVKSRTHRAHRRLAGLLAHVRDQDAAPAGGKGEP
jgi:RNA polymerase sigma-70 factor (ECF subfamily)